MTTRRAMEAAIRTITIQRPAGPFKALPAGRTGTAILSGGNTPRGNVVREALRNQIPRRACGHWSTPQARGELSPEFPAWMQASR